MSSSNNAFVFGSGAGNQFDFFAPGNQIPAPTIAASSTSSHLPPASNDYVTLAQYELVEARYEDVLKRLEILEAEAKGHEATKAMLKTGANNLERAYQSLQKTTQAAETKVKELQISSQGLEKKLSICKAALQMSQDQYKATSRDLDAALKRLDESAAASPPSPPTTLGIAPIIAVESAPVAASPAPPPVLALAPINSVSVAPVPTPALRVPTLALAPVTSVEISPVEIAPPDQTAWKWWLFWVLVLLCGCSGGLFGDGGLGSGEGFGFGGGLVGGDGIVARAHAWVFGLLVKWSGGLEVFV